MKKPVPWGRGIAGVLAGAALVAAGVYGIMASRLAAQCEDARTTTLATIPNPFGSKGIFQAEFNPKYDFVCHEAFIIEHSLPVDSAAAAEAVFKDVKADLAIVDERGQVVFEKKLGSEDFSAYQDPARPKVWQYMLLSYPVSPGHYQLRITVHEPASLLAGVPHRLVAQYMLCGIEMIGAVMAACIALGALLVSVLLTAGIIVVTCKKNRQQAAAGG